ncbi:hypothetical protein [Sinorhizobium sp. BG8]|uniref:hypothetical protein n=1 Tax=Sinorhizobium sp. BG8 TaxID=2613773 RepID=UPI00193DD35E|nr:hypothetical protein [Sinorhizobium sp. BG8]QRM54741.1 hypothetical protein F3Y30_09440 [Sinorhizobium sp. BG8]
METTNTPVEGTGYSVDEAATHIENLLDSDIGTTETVDAENEVDETSNTLDDDVEIDMEQPETDSDDVDEDATESETDEVEEPTVRDPNEVLFEIDGQGISRQEAERGYLRQSNYTKKMQELAEHRKKWIVQEVEFHQVRAQSEQVLNNLAAHVAQVFEMNDFGAEPDWAAEWDVDPYEAQKKRFQWDKDKAAWQQKQAAREAAVKAIYDSQIEVARQNEAYANNKRENAIIESRETLAREMPEVFGEAQKANVNLIAVAKFLNEQGYGEDEIKGVIDARTIKLAYYAKLGMEAAMKVPAAIKKIEAKPALTMPGTTTARTTTADAAYKQDRRRLKRTGSLDDAASLISRLL